ncbi:MAG: phosphotransferase family protein [Acidimicrobiales bacterium]
MECDAPRPDLGLPGLDLPGLDLPGLDAWLPRHIRGSDPPYSYELIPGGRSNLTYKVTDSLGARLVLRRPPVSHVLPTAHDVVREHAVISALDGTGIPVPPALAVCEDPGVTGAPFFVMGYVDGVVVRDAPGALALEEASRRHAGEALVDALADIHSLDVDAAGLGRLGPREGYVERQLRRWHRQLCASEGQLGQPVPAAHAAHAALREAMPPERPASLVHGDYRLDNTVLASSGELRAILDWELCTLGNPMADLGLLQVYWREPGDSLAALAGGSPGAPAGEATVVDGFPSRAELADRYARRSGRDLSDLGYFVALGFWKLACILQGVHARYAAGAQGGDPRGIEDLPGRVQALAEASLDLVGAA